MLDDVLKMHCNVVELFDAKRFEPLYEVLFGEKAIFSFFEM